MRVKHPHWDPTSTLGVPDNVESHAEGFQRLRKRDLHCTSYRALESAFARPDDEQYKAEVRKILMIVTRVASPSEKAVNPRKIDQVGLGTLVT